MNKMIKEILIVFISFIFLIILIKGFFSGTFLKNKSCKTIVNYIENRCINLKETKDKVSCNVPLYPKEQGFSEYKDITEMYGIYKNCK